MALIVAIGSLAVRAFGLTKAANYAISLAAAAMEMAMVDLADAMMGAEPGPGSRDNAMKTLTQESNAGHNGAFPPVGRTTVCVRSTSNCQTTRVCNTHTLDCGGPAVHPQRLSHHRCEPGEHEHCQHLVRETMAELKHILDGAARRRANMQMNLSIGRSAGGCVKWRNRRRAQHTMISAMMTPIVNHRPCRRSTATCAAS